MIKNVTLREAFKKKVCYLSLVEVIVYNQNKMLFKGNIKLF